MDRKCNVALAAVLSVAVASCADAQRTAPPPTVTDSAGIRIVTNLLPTGSAATLAQTPTIDIGGGTEAEAQLAGVVGALRLSGGRLAIAEQSTRSIKLFDARGRFIRTIGRQGPGPGEFSSITRFDLLPGDSLAAYDGLRATLTVFDTTGRVGRITHVPAGPGGFQAHGLLSDGTMIGARAYNTNFGRTSRLERDSIDYLAIRPQSSSLDTIVRVPGTDIYMYAGDGFSSRRELPFGRVSMIAVGRDRLYVGTGDGWQIESRTAAGRLVGLHRVRYAPVAVTKSDVARYRREAIERAKGTRVQATGGGGGGPDMRAVFAAHTEKMLDAVPFPETQAPYDSLVVGVNDELWVRATHAFPTEPCTWTVLSRDGAALGTVALPGGMRLLQVGADFLVGVTKDADDVEHVGVYALARGGGRG